MAYLPQNPEDEKNQQSSQVLGPAGQQPQQQGQQAPVGGASQPATIEGGASAAMNAAQQSAPKKPASGQFTNLRNYLQSSAGAGQRIGQAMTGGMQRQAQQIGQAIGQQKAQYQAQIGQQEAARAQAGQQAQKILQRVQAQASQPSEQKQAQEFNFGDAGQQRNQEFDYSRYIAQPELDYIKSNLGDKFTSFQQDLDTAFRPRLKNTGINATTYQAPVATSLDKTTSPQQKELLDLQQKQERDQKLNDLYKKYNINATEMARQAYSVSPEEVAKFRELATGQKTFQDVQDMNLTPQQVQQQQLAQQAENLKTFEGRQGLLKELFGKRQQYGQGSSLLDSALLQREGLPQLLSTTKDITQGVEGQLKDTRQFASSELARLMNENKAFAQGLQTQAETGQSSVIQNLDSQIAQKIAERKAVGEGPIKQMLDQEIKELNELKAVYDPKATRQRSIDSFINIAKTDSMAMGQIRNAMRAAGALGNDPRTGQSINPTEQQMRNFLQGYIDTGKSNFGNFHWSGVDWQPNIERLYNETFNKNLLNQSNVGYTGQQLDDLRNSAYSEALRISDKQNVLNTINKSIRDQLSGGVSKGVSDELLKLTGYGLQDYTTGKDVTRESLASEADRARYNALAALAGAQTRQGYTPALQAQRASNARLAKELTTDEMKNMLAMLSDKYGKKGTSVKGTASTGQRKDTPAAGGETRTII